MNARLREDHPDGFALDASRAPHITILQRFVRTADLVIAPTEDLRRLQQRIIDAFAPFAGTNYNPHLTVGIGTRDFVDALKAEPFEPFTFRAASVSLHQLGYFGVAQRKLHDLHRC